VIIGVAICALGLAVLLAGEITGRAALRFVGKPIASAGFLVAGACVYAPSSFATCVMIGLAIGAIGDIALLFERGFIVGLAAFLLGHLAYVVAVAERVPVVPFDRWISPLAIVPVAVAAVALRWLWPHAGKLKAPVVAYVVAIVAMVIAAIALREPRFMIGAALFFASDLAVARDKFVAPGVINRAWGLPAYYAGQLLIAIAMS
jgi:uncharacterized membrane protein YhhN